MTPRVTIWNEHRQEPSDERVRSVYPDGIHNAIADYGPDEHRLVKRCQVMATRFGL